MASERHANLLPAKKRAKLLSVPTRTLRLLNFVIEHHLTDRKTEGQVDGGADQKQQQQQQQSNGKVGVFVLRPSVKPDHELRLYRKPMVKLVECLPEAMAKHRELEAAGTHLEDPAYCVVLNEYAHDYYKDGGQDEKVPAVSKTMLTVSTFKNKAGEVEPQTWLRQVVYPEGMEPRYTFNAVKFSKAENYEKITDFVSQCQ